MAYCFELAANILDIDIEELQRLIDAGKIDTVEVAEKLMVDDNIKFHTVLHTGFKS
jgi:hypothetical protein